MSKFRVGDKVIVTDAPSQIARWVGENTRGVVQGVYEGQPYPNDVQLTGGAAMCFTDGELAFFSENDPGQRLLNEAPGLSMDLRGQEALKAMKFAFRDRPPRSDTKSNVDHPGHYNQHPSGIECIEITKHMNFAMGNAVKYLWRADLKGTPIEDLKKAENYIRIEIERREERV
ncbi:DUF3310 domain-containing protein [Streptomyces buecherae]|nr:DUF3310 domain-containing protein [Streptomyces buecherae]